MEIFNSSISSFQIFKFIYSNNLFSFINSQCGSSQSNAKTIEVKMYFRMASFRSWQIQNEICKTKNYENKMRPKKCLFCYQRLNDSFGYFWIKKIINMQTKEIVVNANYYWHIEIIYICRETICREKVLIVVLNQVAFSFEKLYQTKHLATFVNDSLFKWFNLRNIERFRWKCLTAEIYAVWCGNVGVYTLHTMRGAKLSFW